MSAAPCSWDTGSMYGCEPACYRPATVEAVHTGYRGPHTTRLCEEHAQLLSARLYPDTVTSLTPLLPVRS